MSDVVKTVFDPSPAGFCVPFYNAFSGFFLGNTPYSDHVENEGRRHTVDATETGLRDFFIPYGGWIDNSTALLKFEISVPSYASGVWTTYASRFNNESQNNIGMFAQRGEGAYQARLEYNRDTRGNPVRPILEP